MCFSSSGKCICSRWRNAFVSSLQNSSVLFVLFCCPWWQLLNVVHGDNWMAGIELHGWHWITWLALHYLDVVNGDNGNRLQWMLSMVNPRDDNVSLRLDYRGISVLCWYDIGGLHWRWSWWPTIDDDHLTDNHGNTWWSLILVMTFMIIIKARFTWISVDMILGFCPGGDRHDNGCIELDYIYWWPW